MSDIQALVAECSPWNGFTFDPGMHIRAVNSLIEHERSAILEGLKDYRDSLKASQEAVLDSTRLLLLVRVLFIPEGPSAQFPGIALGSTGGLGEAAGAEKWPLFPIALIEDVPLLISPGFELGGKLEDPLRAIEFCEEHCRLRNTALRPPDDPLRLADRLLSSELRHLPREEWRRDLAILRAQLLRLVSPAYRVPGVEEPSFFGQLEEEALWEAHEQELTRRNVCWSERENRYISGSKGDHEAWKGSAGG